MVDTDMWCVLSVFATLLCYWCLEELHLYFSRRKHPLNIYEPNFLWFAGLGILFAAVLCGAVYVVSEGIVPLGVDIWFPVFVVAAYALYRMFVRPGHYDTNGDWHDALAPEAFMLTYIVLGICAACAIVLAFAGIWPNCTY